MNKKEILEKSKQEYRNKDEWEVHANQQSMLIGSAVLLLLMVLMMMVQGLWKGEEIFDLQFLTYAHMSVTTYYLYRFYKTKIYLAISIIAGITAILNLFLYIWKG